MGDEVEITTMSQTHGLSVKAGSYTRPEPGPLPSRTWRSPRSSKDSVPNGKKRWASALERGQHSNTVLRGQGLHLGNRTNPRGNPHRNFADAALSPGLRKELLGA